ncbi:MAG: hypothetical protein AMXMBFR82_45070 [Candidatus Hydrogenedentota bacterium]
MQRAIWENSCVARPCPGTFAVSAVRCKDAVERQYARFSGQGNAGIHMLEREQAQGYPVLANSSVKRARIKTVLTGPVGRGEMKARVNI